MADEAPRPNTLQPITDPALAGPNSDLPNDILQHQSHDGANNNNNALAAATLTPAGTGTLTPTAGLDTATPKSYVSDVPMTAEQRSLSLKVSLADLTARASGLFAQRRYDEAAEVYAQAAEMQAEMNGEVAHENAEILFLYGRSLFKVGQEKSDVLGGKAPATEGAKLQKGKKRKERSVGVAKEDEEVKEEPLAGASNEGKSKTETPEADRIAHEAVKIVADDTSAAKAEGKELEGKKPLFQFTGDENWDDSEEEDEGDDEGEGEEQEEDDDDLATAFETLDLARVLFERQLSEKLAALETSEGKGKEVENGEGQEGDAETRHIKERLADTHRCLAEISLENEKYVWDKDSVQRDEVTDTSRRYPQAISDSREALKYSQQLYSEDSEVVAEAHFKLSLALEFAAATAQRGEDGAETKEFDQEMRDEAANELEATIASTKLKLQNKEVELATLHNPEDNEITRAQIADVKEVIADLEQRVSTSLVPHDTLCWDP